MWQAVSLCGAHGITRTVPTFCFCVGCHMGACPLGKDLLEFSCSALKCPLGLCVLDPPYDWVGHTRSPQGKITNGRQSQQALALC